MESVTSGAGYVLHERLASGGMGVVHLGTLVTRAGHRRVAIKRLSPDTATPDAAGRLIAEAELTFRLTHANICQVLDLAAGEDGSTFLVLEYVRGLDLRALLRHEQALAPPLALYIAREVARALDYAHRHTDLAGQRFAIVHGDVTPANILLSVEGEVKLADFGIARALGIAAPGERVRGGTPGFIAPEVFAGVADHRVDIYSLGATLRAALVGIDAHAGDASSLSVWPDLDRIVQRMTAERATDRYLSAADVEHELALVLARRYPEFTPSALAQLVRARVAPETSTTESTTAAKTLVSLITSDTRPSGGSPELPARGTQTYHGTAPARRRRTAVAVAVPLALAAFAALAAGMWLSRARETTVPARDVAARMPVQRVEAPAVIAASESPPTAEPHPAVREPKPPRPPPRPARASATAMPTTTRTSAAPGELTVSSVPWGAVYINSTRVADETPLYRHSLPPGHYEVKIYYPETGRFSAPRTATIEAGKLVTMGFGR